VNVYLIVLGEEPKFHSNHGVTVGKQLSNNFKLFCQKCKTLFQLWLQTIWRSLKALYQQCIIN